MQQCQCLTTKNIQCLNKPSKKPEDDPNFCWKHQNCQKNEAQPDKIKLQKHKTQQDKIQLEKRKTGQDKIGKTQNPQPQYLLTGLAIDMVDLAEYKKLPYDEFIVEVVNFSNEISSCKEEVTVSDLNKQIYDTENISINMNSCGLDGDNTVKVTLKNPEGWTAGQLLYQLAQNLGDYDETEETYGNHVHFDGLLLTDDGSYNINC